jgi:hypothetical protein
MKRMMYLALFGSVLFSIVAGAWVADRVVPELGGERLAEPAILKDSGMTECPAQRGVCPASGARAKAHLQA